MKVVIWGVRLRRGLQDKGLFSCLHWERQATYSGMNKKQVAEEKGPCIWCAEGWFSLATHVLFLYREKQTTQKGQETSCEEKGTLYYVYWGSIFLCNSYLVFPAMWSLSFPVHTRNKWLYPLRSFSSKCFISSVYSISCWNFPSYSSKVSSLSFISNVKTCSYFITSLLLLVFCKVRKPQNIIICIYLTCECVVLQSTAALPSPTSHTLHHTIAGLGRVIHQASPLSPVFLNLIQQKGSQAIPCYVLDGFALCT